MKGNLHKAWIRAQQWSITIEGNITWWSSDDVHQRVRKLDHEIEIPRWIWRPYCWYRGRHDDYYGACVYCNKFLPDSPYAKVKRRAKERT